MKKFILLTVILNLILTAACSTAPNVATNATVVNTAANNPNQAANTNAEVADASNRMLVPMKGMKNLNGQTNQLNPTDSTVANAKAVQVSQPAPYDSTMATTMDKDGRFLETRTFRSDPLIQKLERMQELKKIRVYLKNGKSVELPYEKGFALFAAGSPQDILAAAGMKPATPPASTNPGKVEETKKTEN